MKIYSKILIVFVFLLLSLFFINNQLFIENGENTFLSKNVSELNNQNYKIFFIGIFFLMVTIVTMVIVLNLDILYYSSILSVNYLFFVYFVLKFYLK